MSLYIFKHKCPCICYQTAHWDLETQVLHWTFPLVKYLFSFFITELFSVKTSAIPVLEFRRLSCVCVCVSVFLCVPLFARARAVSAVSWRLMVIAVSRLAFWVELREWEWNEPHGLGSAHPFCAALPVQLRASSVRTEGSDRAVVYDPRRKRAGRKATRNNLQQTLCDTDSAVGEDMEWRRAGERGFFRGRRAPLKPNMALLRGTAELN